MSVFLPFSHFRYLVGIVANNGSLTSEASLKVTYNTCDIVAWVYTRNASHNAIEFQGLQTGK